MKRFRRSLANAAMPKAQKDEFKKSDERLKMTNTIFGKMISGEVPVEPIYEDELCLAIHDIHPQAPVHVLVIPKQSIAQLSAADKNDQLLLGHLLLVANQLATDLGVAMAIE